MELQSLTISLKHAYQDAGPTNPYQAKLDVSYNDNRMTVAISDETCKRILAPAGDEIAAAAQVQISDFVRTASAVSSSAAIEHESTGRGHLVRGGA